MLQNKERKGQLAFPHKTSDKVCAVFPPKRSAILCGLLFKKIYLIVTKY